MVSEPRQAYIHQAHILVCVVDTLSLLRRFVLYLHVALSDFFTEYGSQVLLCGDLRRLSHSRLRLGVGHTIGFV